MDLMLMEFVSKVYIQKQWQTRNWKMICICKDINDDLLIAFSNQSLLKGSVTLRKEYYNPEEDMILGLDMIYFFWKQ